MPEDFWDPALAEELAERTPYVILREQADALSKRTKDVIQGAVTTEQNGERVEHEMTLFAPVLALRVPILRVSREGGTAYPVSVSGRFVKRLETCKGEKTFTDVLKKVLASKEVTRAIQTLHTDSKKSGLRFFLVEDEEVVGETATFRAAKELSGRMIGRGGWIDVHELEKEGPIGYWVWPDDADKPTYHESRPAAAQNGNPASVPAPRAAPDRPSSSSAPASGAG